MSARPLYSGNTRAADARWQATTLSFLGLSLFTPRHASFYYIGVGEAVKAVLSKPKFFYYPFRQAVGVSIIRNGRVERRIESDILPAAGEIFERLIYDLKRYWVVYWRQREAKFEVSQRFVFNKCSIFEVVPAMNEPVANEIHWYAHFMYEP